MKKKIVIIGLSMLMAVSVTACGGKSDEASNTAAVSDSTSEKYNELQEKYDQLQYDYDELKAEYDAMKEEDETVAEKPASTADEDKVYGLGETWTVDGLWSLTFNSATVTDYRNQFSDKNPAQVVYLDYTYQNIGYKGSFMDLYISDGDMYIIDANGELASSYPGSVTNHPQETPVGATCANAQVCVGLNNESSEIQITVELTDSEYSEHTATFKIPVQ